MIQAQMTLPDGKTPGAMRKGTLAIQTALAGGCRIYPNPLNKIPKEWERHVVVLDLDTSLEAVYEEIDRHLEQAATVEPRRRGRPKKVKP